MIKKPVIIAVCGKGGVGKTSISALLTRMFSENTSNRVIAIDADPAEGLSYPLGITVKKTVDDVRNDLIRSIEKGEKTGKEALLKRLDYELFEAIEEKENLAFLAIGRPESDGCYCQVNNLLKEIIKEIVFNFDYVIIDGEAGVEQINRRVMEMVTHLLLVTDASAKGRNVAATIEMVARKNVSFESVGLLLNKIKDKEEAEELLPLIDIPILGWIAENETVREFDRYGKSFFDLPEDSIISTLRSALENLLPSSKT
ncbi:MAG: AAA family ATPase [Deltaproteobacteria bacterium]|nr:AAA family ATPase [Deltaproteobacteria bacterium]